MEYLFEGIKQGFLLLFPPKKDILEIVFLSLLVSGSATLLSAIFSIFLGVFLALREFKGKRILVGMLNTSLSIPSVLIGLLVYTLLFRKGPFGALSLLFTPYAMVIAQCLLAIPIITTLTFSALKGIAPKTRDVAFTLGASNWQTGFLLLKEGRFAFLSAIIMGFSRVIGETGMALIVGGNIKGETRVMTTTIALETMKGNFEIGISLGIVLLLVAIIINVFLQILQGK